MSEKELFKCMILDNSYINWLSNFMKSNPKINDYNFIYDNGLEEYDVDMIKFLKHLFRHLRLVSMKNKEKNMLFNKTYCLCYNDLYYVLKYADHVYSCKVYNNKLYYCDCIIDNKKNVYDENDDLENMKGLPYIAYEQLRYNLGFKTHDFNTFTQEGFYINISENLKPSEKIFILRNLEHKSCTTCTNLNCNNLEVGIDEYGNRNGSSCLGWYNETLVGKSKVLKINDIYKL